MPDPVEHGGPVVEKWDSMRSPAARAIRALKAGNSVLLPDVKPRAVYQIIRRLVKSGARRKGVLIARKQLGGIKVWYSLGIDEKKLADLRERIKDVD